MSPPAPAGGASLTRNGHFSNVKLSSEAGSLATAPLALRRAVAKNLGSNSKGSARSLAEAELQLGATYGPSGARFAGPGFELSVGQGSLVRGASIEAVGARLVRSHLAASYGGGAITESFQAKEAGIEQTFRVGTAPEGSGTMVIDVPVSGLSAATDGRDIDLRDAAGRVRATYSGLRVSDASGRVVAASMRAASDGHAIAIDIPGTNLRYPLLVDPTWSLVTELTTTGQISEDADDDDFNASSVAIDGSTAVVGAAYTEEDGEPYGAAYVYTLSGGTWSAGQELSLSEGDEALLFGWAVGISGSTIVVTAPLIDEDGVEVYGGAFVFTDEAGTWTQTAVLTVSSLSTIALGGSVAISGSTVVVGAADQTVGSNENQGAAYVFTGSGATWSSPQELTATDGEAGDAFSGGFDDFGGEGAVAVSGSGSTIVVGAPGHEVGSNDEQGAAYVFGLSGSTWDETGELTATDGAAYDWFGLSVAMSGSNVLVGAPGHEVGSNSYQGALYVFTPSGDGWAQTEVTNLDGAVGEDFGWTLAVSGSTLLVGAPPQQVGSNTEQGASYVFALSGSTWTQTSELTATDGLAYDQFGWMVAVSGNNIVVDAPGHEVDGHADQGAAYVFSTLGDVEPQGSALVADHLSKSEAACPCEVADPIDPATGDLHETSTDLSLPGSGVPLGFTRTYDALVAQDQVTAGTPAPPLGYGWSYNLGMTLDYDTETGVATINEENGAQITFSAYDSDTSPAWCTSATNFCASAPRIEATLNQNEDGSWTFVRSVGAQETFSFDSDGNLTSIADAAGDTLTVGSYSPTTGQTACPSGDTCEAWTSSASGEELVLDFNSSGQLASVFDANSTLAASFTYSGSGCATWSGDETPDLCTATDPGSLTTAYTYDSSNGTADLDYDLLTETPPGAAGETTNVYNSSGQITQQTDPAGAVTTLAYAGTNSTEAGGTTTVTTYPDGTGSGEPQDQTIYQYSSNVLVAETTAAGTEVITPDPVSLLPLSVEDGDGNVTSTTYQTYSGTDGTPVSSANALTTTDAVGNTTEAVYNSFNQPWCQVDAADYANGVTCPSSAPSSPPSPGSSDPDAGATISFYNSSDQLTAVTDALGNTTTYSYTSGVSGVPDGLMYCSVDPVDYQDGVTCPAYGATYVPGTTTATFDSAGDRTSSTDADGDTTTYAYTDPDNPGLVSSQTDPDGTTTTYTYNAAGQVLSQVVSFDSYSATTLYAYDGAGRLYCEVDPYEAAASLTCPTSPPSSPPTTTSDPYLGATITTYDADGRVIQTTNPLGGITYTAYDDAGEAFCTVGPAEAAADVTCPSFPPSSPPTVGSDSYLGATITTYDANGRPVQVTNPLGGITLTTYDADGNVVETDVESNDATDDPDVVTAYTYDADDRVSSTTVGYGPSSPSTTAQSYDPDGNVYCSVSANAEAAGTSAFQCPAWQDSWISAPPSRPRCIRPPPTRPKPTTSPPPSTTPMGTSSRPPTRTWRPRSGPMTGTGGSTAAPMRPTWPLGWGPTRRAPTPTCARPRPRPPPLPARPRGTPPQSSTRQGGPCPRPTRRGTPPPTPTTPMATA